MIRIETGQGDGGKWRWQAYRVETSEDPETGEGEVTTGHWAGSTIQGHETEDEALADAVEFIWQMMNGQVNLVNSYGYTQPLRG